MKLFLNIVYCLMEFTVDCSISIRKGYYKKHYGDNWQKHLKKLIIGQIESKLNMLSIVFWFVTSLDFLIITISLIDCYVFNHKWRTMSFVLGSIATLAMFMPYYFWRRKNYDELIAKHEYVVDKPRYSKIQKIAVLLAYFIFGLSPLIVLAVFAPLTSK